MKNVLVFFFGLTLCICACKKDPLPRTTLIGESQNSGDHRNAVTGYYIGTVHQVSTSGYQYTVVFDTTYADTVFISISPDGANRIRMDYRNGYPNQADLHSDFTLDNDEIFYQYADLNGAFTFNASTIDLHFAFESMHGLDGGRFTFTGSK